MPTAKVFASFRFSCAGFRRLEEEFAVDVWDDEEPPSRTDILARSQDVDGLLITLNERIDADVLRNATRLKAIATMAVGFDHIDVEACTDRHILVANTPGVLVDATADLTMALMLTMARRIPEAAASVLDGSWGAWRPTWLCGLELRGSTLGIVGYGAVGRAVAARARAFGMNVIHHSRSSGEPLDVVLRTSDVVTLHCPLTPETRRLIGWEQLQLMKPSAILVNTSRGAVVDQSALYTALSSGTIAAAGLDVTEPEPVPPTDPLLRLPNCLVLPHIGSATWSARERMADLATNALCDLLEDSIQANVINA